LENKRPATVITKKRSVRIFLFSLAIFSSAFVFGQPKKIKTVDVSDTITFASIDRPGDIYLTTVSGHLQHFTKEGKLQNLYRKGPSLTSFDPRDGSRLFAYYRDQAQYDLLNPAFDVVASYKIDSAFALEPWQVCASGDHFVWVLDVSGWSLKKIDIRSGAVPVEVPITVKSGKNKTDIIHMREYQNFVFLLDKKEGILIYNSMGKLIRTIPVTNIRYFNFLGEELYYLKGDKLIFFDLFTAENREMKLPAPAEFALLSDERLYLVRKTGVELFEFKP
jgi:hypothetical protein